MRRSLCAPQTMKKLLVLVLICFVRYRYRFAEGQMVVRREKERERSVVKCANCNVCFLPGRLCKKDLFSPSVEDITEVADGEAMDGEEVEVGPGAEEAVEVGATGAVGRTTAAEATTGAGGVRQPRRIPVQTDGTTTATSAPAFGYVCSIQALPESLSV